MLQKSSLSNNCLRIFFLEKIRSSLLGTICHNLSPRGWAWRTFLCLPGLATESVRFQQVLRCLTRQDRPHLFLSCACLNTCSCLAVMVPYYFIFLVISSRSLLVNILWRLHNIQYISQRHTNVLRKKWHPFRDWQFTFSHARSWKSVILAIRPRGIMFTSGIEPETFCVLSKCDKLYTKEICCLILVGDRTFSSAVVLQRFVDFFSKAVSLEKMDCWFSFKYLFWRIHNNFS